MTVQNRLRRSQVGFLVQADWKLAVDWIVCLRLFLNKEKDHVVAYFGEIHPDIIKKIDMKI